jgi:hypothetical protein
MNLLVTVRTDSFTFQAEGDPPTTMKGSAATIGARIGNVTLSTMADISSGLIHLTVRREHLPPLEYRVPAGTSLTLAIQEVSS